MVRKLLLLLYVYLVTETTCKYSYNACNKGGLTRAHVASVADDPIVSKLFPASVKCRRTSQQRMYERSVASTEK